MAASALRPLWAPHAVVGGLALVCSALGGCGPLILSHPTAAALASKSGFTWAPTTTTEHFDSYAEVGSRAERDLPAFQIEAERTWGDVLEFIGEERYDERVSIFLVDSRQRMKDLIGLSINATGFYKTNVVCLVAGALPPATVGHELVHVIATNEWGTPDRWINEGFAVAFDGRILEYEIDDLAKYLLERGLLPSLDDLTRRFSRLPNRASYPAAGSFVKYMLDTYGLAAVRQVWKEGRRALPSATGVTSHDLEQHWLAAVREANATGITYELNR